MKLLVAFDFDHTIIHCNSDIAIQKLIPKEFITEELKELRNGPLWLDYMQEIFNILHKNNVKEDEILNVCGNFECTEGMIELIKSLKAHGADIIIISDANIVFIEHWLKCKNIYGLINKIYTNPGKFNENGLLQVQMYHNQDWCDLSTRNMCKGYILEKHLEEMKKENNFYDIVAYIGDGRNDLCPLLKLRDVDHCFPRINYVLYKILNENEEIRSKVTAAIHPWNNGQDILSVLLKLFS